MPPDAFITSDSDLESVISLQATPTKIGPPSRRNSLANKYLCSFEDCGAVFKRLDHLDRHEYKHTGIKKHACLYADCNKSYSILTHLKRHLRTTHERVEQLKKDVHCTVDGCDKLFTSNCNMQRHIREVHENPKCYECSYCNEKFTQKLKMRRHEIIKHTKEYPYNCDKCSRGFYQKWQYERHHANCKIYPCPNCEQQFDKWSLYMKHCKEMQHGRKYYKCEHCERLYCKPSELQKHIADMHLDGVEKMRYKCTHEGCERFYAYERNLKQHVLTAHSGKRFECSEVGCSRLFSSAQNLSKHLKRGHNSKSGSETVVAVVSEKATKVKKTRKRRKDAGHSAISNLAKMANLAVDKQFDKLLRAREENAMNAVTQTLMQEMHVDEQFDDSENMKPVPKIALNKEQELHTLLSIALQD